MRGLRDTQRRIDGIMAFWIHDGARLLVMRRLLVVTGAKVTLRALAKEDMIDDFFLWILGAGGKRRIGFLRLRIDSICHQLWLK